MPSLKDKVIFITGASRGIGAAMALRFAKEGANIVIAAKTAEAHPTLPGTIHTVAEEVEEAGGKALPIALDVRNVGDIEKAIEKTISHFGQLDVLINNASALGLHGTLDTSIKEFDLLFMVNVRATFACSKVAIPHLEKSDNPHILNMAPPLNLSEKWFSKYLIYSMSKFGMSMCTLGMAEELHEKGIKVNSLWPKTLVATSAVKYKVGEPLYNMSRKPEIVADAAREIITSDSHANTGHFYIDEDVLRQHGVTDFSKYAMSLDQPPPPDLFLD